MIIYPILFVFCLILSFVGWLILASVERKRDDSSYEDFREEKGKLTTQETIRRNRNYERMCNPDLKDKGWF